MTDKPNDTEQTEVRMKREIGPIAATMIIVGAIIGSGIYVSPIGKTHDHCTLFITLGSINYNL